MSALRIILGDQLSHNISSLQNINKKNDTVMMCEIKDEATFIKHHKKKIAFIFSAMRHFAQQLEDKKINILYSKIEDKDNTHHFVSEIKRRVNLSNIDTIFVTAPSEYRLLKEVETWQEQLNVPVAILDDDRFVCTINEFSDWAEGKKQLTMEFFYRYLRKKHNILMESGKPMVGKWNYDADNRKRPNKSLVIPKPTITKPDVITGSVLSVVDKYFSDHFGDLEPFYFAVTHQQATQVLQQFIAQRLVLFGDYQDAMIEGEPWMYHAHIGFYLNIGLLLPKDVIALAEQAYIDKKAPLNAVEGFIRQVLGWREYVRGIYWLKMPEYETQNFFNCSRNLPDFYWTGKTKMNCLKQCVEETKANAYAHHIQRLMVLGNFALIAGIQPEAVNNWFWVVYADAYQWVELPNVSGMILFADGGFLATKPYAAGGAYINKMSDYCKNCYYKVSKKVGEDACPFNYLYWDFLQRNRENLKTNHRVAMMYRTYDRMNDEKKEQIENSAQEFLKKLEQGQV